MEPIDTMPAGGKYGKPLPVFAIDGETFQWHKPTEVFILNLWKVKHPTTLAMCIERKERFIIQNKVTKKRAVVVYEPPAEGKVYAWRVHEISVPHREWGMRIQDSVIVQV